MSSLFSRLLSPLGAIMALFFIMPWLSVTGCSMPVIDDASGMDLANSIVIMGEEVEGAPELYVVLGAGIVIALVGLAFWFNRGNPIVSIICLLSSLAAVALLFFYWRHVQSGMEEEDLADFVIVVTWEFGYIGSVLAAGVAVLASIISFLPPTEPPPSLDEQSYPQPSPPSDPLP